VDISILGEGEYILDDFDSNTPSNESNLDSLFKTIGKE
jgi:hypothetical protein